MTELGLGPIQNTILKKQFRKSKEKKKKKKRRQLFFFINSATIEVQSVKWYQEQWRS
jgi:hypothetical protein